LPIIQRTTSLVGFICGFYRLTYIVLYVRIKFLQVARADEVDRGSSNRVGENRKGVIEPRNWGCEGYLGDSFLPVFLALADLRGAFSGSRIPIKGRLRYSSL
jgi:hypothetical protein